VLVRRRGAQDPLEVVRRVHRPQTTHRISSSQITSACEASCGQTQKST
jgi:hypothetical protein